VPVTPPLITATAEKLLNVFLWRDDALKSPRQRLKGKVLKLSLRESGAPLALVFSEQQIDVSGNWEGDADCVVITRLSTLVKLRDRQQLAQLIKSGELEVDGDLQVVQNLVALIDMAELDPAELLAPWVGDIAAEGIGKLLRGGGRFLKKRVARNQRYLAEALTEEWRLAPGPLEVAWFVEETDALARDVEALIERLDCLEDK
jgi:ubiquinone biosynthesis protein UbiJ